MLTLRLGMRGGLFNEVFARSIQRLIKLRQVIFVTRASRAVVVPCRKQLFDRQDWGGQGMPASHTMRDTGKGTAAI